jgi:hypothetical protein
MLIPSSRHLDVLAELSVVGATMLSIGVTARGTLTVT